MRHPFRLTPVIGGLLNLLLTPIVLYGQQPPAGRVTALQGTAQLSRPTLPTPASLRFRDDVFVRDVINTREKSVVRVLFGGKSTVTVRELTRLEVREEAIPGGGIRSVHDLSSGGILVNVAKQLMRPGDEVIIRTPNAVAAVRGSAGLFEYNPASGQSKMTGLQGEFIVNTPGGPTVTVTLRPGQSTIVSVDRATGAAQIGPTTNVSPSQIAQEVQTFNTPLAVTQEANQQQIAGAQTQQAGELASAVVTAIMGTGPTSPSQQLVQDAAQVIESGSTEQITTTNIATTTTTGGTVIFAPVTPDISQGSEDACAKNPSQCPQASAPPVTAAVEPITPPLTSTLPLAVPGDLVFTGGDILDFSDGNPHTFNTITQSGGTLTGSDTVTVLNSYTWTGGTQSGSGSTEIPLGGSLIISGFSEKILDARTLNNAGTATLNEGTFSLINGATFNSTGLFSSTASVDIQNGTLMLLGGGTNTGSFTVASGSTLNFGGGTHDLNSGSLLTGAGTVNVSSGTVNLNASGLDRLTGTLGVSGGNLNVTGNLVGLSTGQTLNPTGTMLIVSGGNISVSDNLFNDGGTLTMSAPLVSTSGGSLNIANSFLRVVDGSTFTSTTGNAAIQLSGSTVNAGSTVITLSSRVAQIPPAMTVDGPLLTASNNTNIIVSNPDLGSEDLLFIADSAKLTGPPKPSVGDAPAAISFNNSSLTTTGPLLGIRRSLSPTTPTTIELGGPLLIATGSTFDVASSFVSITESAKMVGAGTTPLIQSNSSSFDLISIFFRLNDASNVAVNPGVPGPATANLAGPLLSDFGSTFTLTSRFLSVGGGSTLSSASTDPFIQFSGSTVNTGVQFAQVDAGGKITLSGPFLAAANSNFAIGPSPARTDFIDVRNPNSLFKSTAPDPLVTLDPTTVASRRFLNVINSGAMDVAGPVLKDTGGNFRTASDFAAIHGLATFTGSGLGALFQFQNSILTIGTDATQSGNFLRMDQFGLSGVALGPATMDLKGSLLADLDSNFTMPQRFVTVSDGSTLISTSTAPLILFTGSTVNTGSDFTQITGTDSTGTGSKITLSGSLLSAGSTLNIGTDPTVAGDLLDINSGGQLVMSSADPVIQLNGGIHNIGTADATVNNTTNRLFRLVGVNTDPTTGLGIDQPIKGTGVDPAPFIDSFTGASANNPVGSLLTGTNGATIEVKKGAGDTVTGGIFAGNALRLDTALLEASAPIINLLGTATPPDTILTTAGDAMDISRSRVISLGPVVALDKGLINVTNGALITLRNGSNMNVTGDLLSLTNGSRINVVNGPLIRVDGVALGGTAPAVSTLNVSGALVNFGGTGGNQIVVNNGPVPIVPTATLSGIPVSSTGTTPTGVPSSIAIGPNPIKNPGLGNIIIPAGHSLIQATNGGRANITAP